MKKFTKIAASAAAAVLLTATAVPVVPAYAETYQVEYEALAGKISVSKLTIGKIADQTYTGKAIKPSVTVKYGKTKLKAGTDYTLTYKNNKKVGTATVTITGKGKYSGKKNVTFKIVKKGSSAGKLKVTDRIKWMAWWDIEDENDEAQKLFRKTYGTPKKGEDPSREGRIFEYINVAYGERYDKLATAIQSGDSPDLFPFEIRDFPYGVLKGRYQPVDKILDLSDSKWDNTRDVMENFKLNGRYYCAFTEISFDSLLYYRKSVIKDAGLKDPRTLFEKDEWTWDAFLEMARKFQNSGDYKYVIDGYNSDNEFVASTGTPIVSNINGVITNNMYDANVDRAMDLLSTLQKENLRYPRHELNGWTVNPKAWAQGDTLFYGNGGTWEFEGSYGLKKYAQRLGWADDEICVVPYPRDPQADKYYHLMKQDALMWCKGSTNKNGVSAYLNCMADASQSKTAASKAKKDALAMGWFSKNWDFIAKQTALNGTSKLTPVFELKNGLGSDIASVDTSDSNVEQLTKYVYLQGEKSYTQLREANFAVIDARINEINEAVKKLS